METSLFAQRRDRKVLAPDNVLQRIRFGQNQRPGVLLRKCMQSPEIAQILRNPVTGIVMQRMVEEPVGDNGLAGFPQPHASAEPCDTAERG